MMNQETFEKVIDLMSQDELDELLASCNSTEEVAAILKEHGAEVSSEDVQMFISFLLQESGEELSEEDLEAVSGGCVFCKAYEAVKKTVKKIKKTYEDVKKAYEDFKKLANKGFEIMGIKVRI